MTYDHPRPVRVSAMDPIYAFLLSFPIACFTLTLITDIAYTQTLNLLWLHFSEWLLLAGLVFGIVAAVIYLVDFIVRRVRPAWSAVLMGIVVLLLAALNSFIHTSDGWTAVVPYGLAVSALTVIAIVLTGWLEWRSVRHV